jgi:hypothetical protein
VAAGLLEHPYAENQNYPMARGLTGRIKRVLDGLPS